MTLYVPPFQGSPCVAQSWLCNNCAWLVRCMREGASEAVLTCITGQQMQGYPEFTQGTGSECLWLLHAKGNVNQGVVCFFVVVFFLLIRLCCLAFRHGKGCSSARPEVCLRLS